MTAANLPERAYAYHPETGATIMLKRREQGFGAVTSECKLADPAEFTEADAILMLAPPNVARVS